MVCKVITIYLLFFHYPPLPIYLKLIVGILNSLLNIVEFPGKLVGLKFTETYSLFKDKY